LLAKPEEVTHFGRSRDAVELHLERHDTLVAALDDEVDLMVPTCGLKCQKRCQYPAIWGTPVWRSAVSV